MGAVRLVLAIDGGANMPSSNPTGANKQLLSGSGARCLQGFDMPVDGSAVRPAFERLDVDFDVAADTHRDTCAAVVNRATGGTPIGARVHVH
jgi:hypothetical protein